MALPEMATLEALIKLQHRHMTKIPFENIDVFFGREIDLSRKRSPRKSCIVGKCRKSIRGSFKAQEDVFDLRSDADSLPLS